MPGIPSVTTLVPRGAPAMRQPVSAAAGRSGRFAPLDGARRTRPSRSEPPDGPLLRAADDTAVGPAIPRESALTGPDSLDTRFPRPGGAGHRGDAHVSLRRSDRVRAGLPPGTRHDTHRSWPSSTSWPSGLAAWLRHGLLLTRGGRPRLRVRRAVPVSHQSDQRSSRDSPDLGQSCVLVPRRVCRCVFFGPSSPVPQPTVCFVRCHASVSSPDKFRVDRPALVGESSRVLLERRFSSFLPPARLFRREQGK
jgi:hypothetical protein